MYFSFRITHLLSVGFVPLGNLLGNIEEELKIQKLPAKVPDLFLKQKLPGTATFDPSGNFCFLAVVLIPLYVVPSHLIPFRNSQRRGTTPLPPSQLFPDNFV